MYLTFKLKRALVVCMIVCAAAAAVFLGAEYEKKVSAAEEIHLPVIMYHSLLKDPKMQGNYVISPDLFEKDLQYLKEHGYEAVFIEDLLKYVEKGEALPEKPVLITFDDGYYNNYHYAYPLAKQYGMKIVISPVGSYMDASSKEEDLHVSYSYITWENMKEMEQSGLVEFQNHTYNLHSSKGRQGTKRLVSESEEEYKRLLQEDLGAMQNKMEDCLGKRPPCFTYPFGAISKGEPEIIRQMGFRCTLTCESRMNTITRDAESLYNLGRYLRTSKLSSEDFFKKILQS